MASAGLEAGVVVSYDAKALPAQRARAVPRVVVGVLAACWMLGLAAWTWSAPMGVPAATPALAYVPGGMVPVKQTLPAMRRPALPVMPQEQSVRTGTSVIVPPLPIQAVNPGSSRGALGSVRAQAPPPPPENKGSTGRTVDQDGKSNVWAVEPTMQTVKDDNGWIKYAPVLLLAVGAVVLIPLLPTLFEANPDQA